MYVFLPTPAGLCMHVYVNIYVCVVYKLLFNSHFRKLLTNFHSI